MPQLDTLQSLLDGFSARPDHPAIIGLAGEERWDYARLEQEVRATAADLRQQGLTRGERVGVLAPNSAAWIAAALAIIAAGGAVVPLDVMMGREDLAHVLKDSGLRRVFTTADRVELMRQLGADGIEFILLQPNAIDAERRDGARLQPGDAALPSLAPEDIAAHFYTSGTSGAPKGVPLTHANITANIRALLAEELVAPDERVCLPLPLFHVYPFVVGLLTPLAAGATMILPAGVSGPELAQALREERATALIGVPRLYDALVAAIRRRVGAGSTLLGGAFARLLSISGAMRRRYGWGVGRVLFRPVRGGAAPALRLLISGGAKLEPELAYALEGLGWEVLTGYGLTETSPIVTFNRRGTARLDTAGLPLPGVELRIDQPDENGVGEVVVRGPNVFAGYHNLPQQTAEVLSRDGWFRTGDLGRLDADGYLLLTGRRSSVLVLPGGKKVDPEAIEESYAALPAIREMAVLLSGSRLVALVVPAEPGEGQEAIGAAIREISPTLPSYRRVTDFALTPEPLPRTSLGKIRRFQLSALYDAAKAGRVAARPRELSAEDRALLEAEPARRVWDWLHKQFADKPVAMDASLQIDLGIDSLDWVSLGLDLQETTGVRLTEDALARVTTVRDLVRAAVALQGSAPAEAAGLGPEQMKLLEPPGTALRLIGGAAAGVNRAAFVWPYPLTVQGRELIPSGGRVLFAPNHLSFLDPFAVGAALPGRIRRQTWWAGFSDLLHGTALRRSFSRAAQVFPVNELAPSSSLAFAKAVLERGDNLVWFPEGARSMDGLLQPLMAGIGMLIEETRPTVVPVFIRGTYEAWPRGQAFPRPHRISVTFGAPLTPDQLEAMGEGDQPRQRIVSGLSNALVQLGRPA